MSPEILLSVVVGSPFVGFLLARIIQSPSPHTGSVESSSQHLADAGSRGIRISISGIVACLAMAVSFAATLPLANRAFSGDIATASLGNWIEVGTVSIDLSLTMTAVGGFMSLIITGVGLLIHIFSLGYMAPEVRQNRYFSYLNLFVFFMLLLVLGSTLPITFIGWEGVGLCSYLLISFWFENEQFAKAGKKAFIVNRIGDLGFLMAIFLLLVQGQSLNAGAYHQQLAQDLPTVLGFPYWEAVAFFLLLGAVGKSAQIPLFVWLPDAMAGPTPVSALIHAATMVTAGVFLIIQYGAIFAAAPAVLTLMGWLAAATALYGALVALVKTDIKKVLAYSTVSQLGLMFLALAVGAETGALYHVLVHAFFKGCLFLAAGAVIFGCHHEQDIRKMGGLFKYMPITAATFLAAALTASGLPPFGAFFSKGMIVSSLEEHTLLFAVAEIVSVCTAAYMARLFCWVFLGSYRGEEKPHEVSLLFTVPLVVLAALSVSSGIALGGGSGLSRLLLISEGHGHVLTLGTGLLHAWPAFLGLALGIVFWRLQPLSAHVKGVISNFSLPAEKGFYVDEGYKILFVRPLYATASVCSQIVERAVSALNELVPALLMVLSRIGQTMQSGQVRLYGLLLLMGSGLLLVVIG